jgi:hypothetical protein
LTMKTIASGFCVLLLAACAHQQPQSQDGVVAANKVSNPAPIRPQIGRATAGTPVAATSAAADSNGAPQQPPINAALVKQGYHARMRKGELYYCRSEQLTGSRFDTQICLTEAQIVEEQRRAKDTLLNNGGHCADPVNCRS